MIKGSSMDWPTCSKAGWVVNSQVSCTNWLASSWAPGRLSISRPSPSVMRSGVKRRPQRRAALNSTFCSPSKRRGARPRSVNSPSLTIWRDSTGPIAVRMRTW